MREGGIGLVVPGSLYTVRALSCFPPNVAPYTIGLGGSHSRMLGCDGGCGLGGWRAGSKLLLLLLLLLGVGVMLVEGVMDVGVGVCGGRLGVVLGRLLLILPLLLLLLLLLMLALSLALISE